MERMHTALDLSERDNARLRAELQRIATASAGGGGGGAAAAAAAAAAAVQRGGLQEDLLAKYEALQLECAQSTESLRLARKAAASQEAYLGVLESEASEAARRNEAQQRRLETLTAETSKLRKEVTKLRSDATAERMTAFEMDLLQQELKVAKDAAGAMVACMQVLTTAPAPLFPTGRQGCCGGDGGAAAAHARRERLAARGGWA